MKKSQRFAFFVFALLLHAGIFYLIFNLIVFSAPITSEPLTSFAELKVPIRPVIPPEQPSSPVATTIPNVAPPAMQADVAPIITAVSSSFTMPKVDITPTITEAMNRVPAPAASDTPSTNTSASSNNPGAGIATSSYGDMDAALKGDDRQGEIIGDFIPQAHPFNDAPEMDAIRQRLLTVIGWQIDTPDHGMPGIKHGTDVPLLVNHSQFFLTKSSHINEMEIYIQTLSRLKDANLKTYVIVTGPFDNPTPASFGDQFRDDAGAQQKQDENLHRQQLAQSLVDVLRGMKTRLCIISFGDAPQQIILDYVKESGGMCLYPHGVPADQIANAIQKAATAQR